MVNNTTTPNLLYPVANALASDNAFVDQFSTRSPTSNDTNYPIQKKWLNTTTGQLYELQNFVSSNGVVTANWILIGSSSLMQTITGNTGGAVPPTANNINVVGDGTYITTVGTPGTSTLTIEPAGGLTTLYTENTGTATPMAGNLNIVGGSGVTTTGSGNTITISLTGGGTAIDSIAVQTGTSPVVPTVAGLVTFNGAVVAAGTNPVRSNGTGANTYALEVQISQALAAADATKIGLANFDSVSFSVSSNGFVTMSGGGGFTWSDQSGTFTAAKNHGYFITGTATANLPASPAQGDTIKFFVDHASQVLTIDAPGSQIIRLGSLVSSAGGTATSTLQGDSVELVYRSTNTCWEAVCGFTGTWLMA